jgi:hypothetical protein
MEAMLEISLYSYVYLKLAKRCIFLIISYVFLYNKIGEQDSGTGSAWKGGVGRKWPKLCIHMRVNVKTINK